LVSVAALLYWAINVAAAHISSRVTTHVDALKTISTVGVWVSTAPRENSAKRAFASMASQAF
jgi:hypothetical protein